MGLNFRFPIKGGVRVKKLFLPSMRKAFLLAVCILFTVTSTGTAFATAESEGDETDRSVFYGKVTAVDGNSITVAVATLDMPGGFGQRANGDAASNGQSGVQGGSNPSGTEQPGGETVPGGRRNFANNLTFTGESVTVQITDGIVLTKQGTQADSNMGAPNPQGQDAMGGNQGNAPAGSPRPQGTAPMRQGPGFAGEEATLEDITVDSIVVLTYQTSTQALLSVHIFSTLQTAGE
jgi:hypothetical protein